ncbi:unnamed protein product [Adineta steineri]|uniref:Uncharacterized protein n=1 Tax=Adineta steineri TaxID=433720 RepID=A0A815HPV0_9BILA|nr:unnamed protein product [Adineta steineri]
MFAKIFFATILLVAMFALMTEAHGEYIFIYSFLTVARAGRFGTKGLAITYVADESDAAILNEVQSRFEVQITEMPDEIDVTTYIENR